MAPKEEKGVPIQWPEEAQWTSISPCVGEGRPNHAVLVPTGILGVSILAALNGKKTKVQAHRDNRVDFGNNEVKEILRKSPKDKGIKLILYDRFDDKGLDFGDRHWTIYLVPSPSFHHEAWANTERKTAYPDPSKPSDRASNLWRNITLTAINGRRVIPVVYQDWNQCEAVKKVLRTLVATVKTGDPPLVVRLAGTRFVGKSFVMEELVDLVSKQVVKKKHDFTLEEAEECRRESGYRCEGIKDDGTRCPHKNTDDIAFVIHHKSWRDPMNICTYDHKWIHSNKTKAIARGLLSPNYWAGYPRWEA